MTVRSNAVDEGERLVSSTTRDGHTALKEYPCDLLLITVH